MITRSEFRTIIIIIMSAMADGLKDPYLVILNLITSEHLKIYNKEIIGLSNSDRYDLTRSKWNDLYH